MTCTPSPAVRRHTRAARWLAAASVALLAACATPTTRFYTLAEPPPKATPNRPTAPDAAPLVIEMAPLGLPERLARPQMLVREARKARMPDRFAGLCKGASDAQAAISASTAADTRQGIEPDAVASDEPPREPRDD